MSFRGITILAQIEDDPPRVAALKAVMDNVPKVESWWALFPHLQREHLTGQNMQESSQAFLWVARPPGIWVCIVRYEEELIANCGFFPLEADWERVHQMMREHGAGLICKASHEIGLVPVYAQAPGGVPTPLAPGFGKEINDISEESVLGPKAKGREMTIKEKEINWPDGVIRPFIIGLDTGRKLMDEKVRQALVEQHSGIWLIAMNKPVYEVL